MLEELLSYYPQFTFKTSTTFMWDPSDNTIHYDPSRANTNKGLWSLLHEIGHGLSEHRSFNTDLELIKIEVSAWEHAKIIAKQHGMIIDDNHIQDCLDSYRDWLKKRSTCPECRTVNMQQQNRTYECGNCGCKWHVSHSQLCSVRTKQIA